MKTLRDLIRKPTAKTVLDATRTAADSSRLHQIRVKDELIRAGADAYDLLLPETHYLPQVIHADESIKGAVYGKYDNGRGALFVTDRRVLFIDKKPFFVNCEEMNFAVIGGLTRTQVGLVGTVTLHTKLGNFRLRTFNQGAALHFMNSVEEILSRASL